MVPLVPSTATARISSARRPSCDVQARMASSAAARQSSGRCSYQPSTSAAFSAAKATDCAAQTSPRSSATTHRTPCVPTSKPMYSIFLTLRVIFSTFILYIIIAGLRALVNMPNATENAQVLTRYC